MANENNYFVFSYDAKYEMLVRNHVAYLRNRINEDKSISINVVECDLYEIILSILVERGYLLKNFAMEKKSGSARVYQAITHTLRLTQSDDQVIEYIKTHVKSGDIIFITGVGKAFPFIRSHTVLNNIFKAADHCPVILFFPGTFDGQELNLFGALKDANYYRAVPLVED
ncbi:DUF1788 domain-containing protein [Sporolactobacillus terrae]|uniref:DUF1788 domain-containing protein n=1 Tax=Sporolactobacillus terrae TaxID=269673 RepID=A0A5K7X0E9_9BACL|nr:DUF1788 domain-containing protein [Sporolactobacillus terrae]BBN98180.1 hypothetical protein St703_08850 [Sporolactobacillus terrae]